MFLCGWLLIRTRFINHITSSGYTTTFIATLTRQASNPFININTYVNLLAISCKINIQRNLLLPFTLQNTKHRFIYSGLFPGRFPFSTIISHESLQKKFFNFYFSHYWITWCKVLKPLNQFVYLFLLDILLCFDRYSFKYKENLATNAIFLWHNNKELF